MKTTSVLSFVPLSIETSSDIIHKIPAGCLGKFEFKQDNHVYQLLYRFSYTQYELDLMNGKVDWIDLCVRVQSVMNHVKEQKLPVMEAFKEGVENLHDKGIRFGSSRDILLKQKPMIKSHGHLLHQYVLSLDASIRDTLLKSDYISRTWMI